VSARLSDTPGADGVRFVEVDGLRLRIAVHGTGQPLLLLMGIGGNLDMWEPFVSRLPRDRIQTIAFDAPGTGGSSGYRLPKRLPGLARTVERLVDVLGYDRVDVLGVSFGGAIAQQLAHQAPDRVGRLILAATMPGIGGVPGSPRVLLALVTPRRYLQPTYHARVAARLYGGRAATDPEWSVDESAAWFRRPPTWAGYLAQLYAVPGWTSIPWLHGLPHRTLVLTGDDDPIVPVVNGRILACRIPNARLHVVRGGGHLFLLEDSDGTAAVVTDFLAAAER
jgi:poly(3-hydroxyoctanoate) depolymerase